MKPNLSTILGKLNLKNPVMTASGTFGYGEEYAELIDIERLGAIVTKTVTLEPREGNPPPRTRETASGLLNSIGLENCGVETFIKDKLPFLRGLDTAIIVSIGGERPEEYRAVLERLCGEDGIVAVEANISCPNVDMPDRRLIAQDANCTHDITKMLRGITNLPLIIKLTPNVGDIASIAKAAEDGGADAVSLVNTLTGMAINVDERTPYFKRVVAGLSGPCIKPVALRMVWEVYNAVSIPIIGMGGIMTAQDALEFIIAGASAVAVGTATFVDTKAAVEIIEGIENYLKKNGITEIGEIVGSLKV